MVANGEDTSSEEEREDQNIHVNVKQPGTDSLTPSGCGLNVTNSEVFNGQVTSQSNCSMSGLNSSHSHDDEDDDDDSDADDDGGGDDENDHNTSGVGENSIPTIYFSHTVEPKRVRILLTLLIFFI